jgi:hypothetical protein
MFEQAPGDHKDHIDLQPEPDTAFLKEISTAALTKLLIKKGLVTPSEILQQERELRSRDFDHSIGQTSAKHSNKNGRVRQWASKKRWSRQLTSTLFGWEWKKTRHEKPSC